MIDEHSFGYDVIEEEDGFTLSVQSVPWRGLADELAELHYLRGAQFIRQLKLITDYGDFHLVDGETAIYSLANPKDEDYLFLLDAARKAASLGYSVYILPNPKNIRTADFILVQRNIYKMYDLKTIHGKSSVINRLMESIGQTRHVILNMSVDYSTRKLTSDLKKYFEVSQQAVEVLIFRGRKAIIVNRRLTQSPRFYAEFKKMYEK